MALSTQHVPAWKRLGLKLKNVPDVPQVTDLPKRKREPETVEPLSSKKPKTEAAASPGKGSQTDAPLPTKQKKSKKPKPIIKASSPSRDNPSTAEILALSTPSLARQKSVSFTPETKIEDGESIKQLFTAWVAEQKAKDPNFVLADSQPAFSVPEPTKVQEIVDASLPEKEKRVQRVHKAESRVDAGEVKQNKEKRQKEKKDKKKANKQQQETKKPDLDPALKYLDQFCNHKDTWKFNKIHQINLLRNVFSERSIPSANVEQFYKYTEGLQGHARVVLRDSAIAVKVKDMEDGAEGFGNEMADAGKTQAEYERAVKEYVATMVSADAPPKLGYEEGVLSSLSDYSMRTRMIKRMRAERIMKELSEPEEPKRRDDGKLVRKRKQRTAIDISDSSSSESESDGSEKATPTKKRVGESTASRADTTTANSSTTISKESESESESGTDTDTSESSSDSSDSE